MILPCTVAYQMSAVHALEKAVGVKISGPLRELRRLLYCGEWIESHGGVATCDDRFIGGAQ